MIKLLQELTGKVKEIKKGLLVTGIKKNEIYDLYWKLFKLSLEEGTKFLMKDSLFVNLECEEGHVLKLYSTEEKEIVSASKLLKSALMKHALKCCEIAINSIDRVVMKELSYQKGLEEKKEEIEAIKVTEGQLSFGMAPTVANEELTEELRASEIEEVITDQRFDKLVKQIVEYMENSHDFTHLIDDLDEETQQLLIDEANILINEEREEVEETTEEMPGTEEVKTVDHTEIKTKSDLADLSLTLKPFLEMNPMFTMNDLLKLTYSIPLDAELMTFNVAKSKGLKIIKGSKSYTFWAKKRSSKKKKVEESEDQEEKKGFSFYGICKLFTMDQIESPEDDKKKKIEKVEIIEEVKEVIKPVEKIEKVATQIVVKPTELVDDRKDLRTICFDLKMNLTTKENINKYYEARIEIVKRSPGAKRETGIKELKRLEKLKNEKLNEIRELTKVTGDQDNAEHLRATEVHLRATLKEIDIKDYEARYQIKKIMTECFTEKTEEEKVKLRRKIKMAYNRANEGQVLKEQAVKIGESKGIEVEKNTRILSVSTDSYNAYDRQCSTGDLNKIQGMKEISARVFVGENGKVEIIYNEDQRVTDLREETEKLSIKNSEVCRAESGATEKEKEQSRVDYYHSKIDLLLAENKVEGIKQWEKNLEDHTKSLEAWENLENKVPNINKLTKKDMCKYLNKQRKENKWWLFKEEDYKKDQLIKKISLELLECGSTKGLEKGIIGGVVKTPKVRVYKYNEIETTV